MKLLAPEGDLRALKVFSVASFAGVSLERQVLELGKDDIQPEFLKKSLMGRYPVLETPEGCISESNAICRYIAKKGKSSGFSGANEFSASQVDMWMDFCTYEVEIPVCCLVQGKVVDKAQQDIGSALKALNEHLMTRTYMVGERVTAADVCLAVVIAYAEKSGKLPPKFVSEFPHLSRWLSTVTRKAEFLKVEETMKKATVTAAGGPEGKPDKPKDYFQSLPPTDFDMDSWKREYSNTKDFDATMKYFWGLWDKYKDAFDLWYMKYDKVEGECEVQFVTSNMLGGFLQCLEDAAFRRNSFGVCHVVGEPKSYDIEGVWLLRGHEHPPVLKEHRSYEYYNFKRLTDSEEDKKLIAEYWRPKTETLLGRPCCDTRQYK